MITIAGLRRNPTFLNISSLYLSLAFNAVISLVLIGYLARVLQPAIWGMVLLAQAFGNWVAMIPEYGFNLSAARAVAQAEDPEQTSRVAHSVNASRVALSVLVLPVAAIAFFAIPGFLNDPAFLVGGALFAIAAGMDPIWLFLGLERQYLYAFVTSASRLVVLAAILLLVKGPEDGWLVMWVHAAGSAGIFMVGLLYALKKLPRRRVELADVGKMLGSGWPMFQLRLVQSLGGSVLLILGAVSPKSVEAFGSADRIARLSAGLLGPISAAGMPRITKLLRSDVTAAQRTARLSFSVMAGLGLLIGALIFAAAPRVVVVLLGPGYEFVTPVLQIAAVGVPLAAASNMVSVQWMLPLGLDHVLVKITLATGLLTVTGCTLFGWLYGAMGAAVTVLVAEVFAITSMIVCLRRAGRATFW